MTNKIITIGRQFGSNGRIIGQQLANKLGIPFYDKELLNKTAKNSGLSEQILSSLDEKPTKSFLYSLVMDPYNYTYSGGGMQINLNQQAFQATYDTIKKIADEGPCVIVGRCADYILKDNKNVLKIFLYSDDESKVKRADKYYGLPKETALKEINKINKKRSKHYQFYTGRNWQDFTNYDLLINVDHYGVEQTAEEIKNIIINNYAKKQ